MSRTMNRIPDFFVRESLADLADQPIIPASIYNDYIMSLISMVIASKDRDYAIAEVFFNHICNIINNQDIANTASIILATMPPFKSRFEEEYADTNERTAYAKLLNILSPTSENSENLLKIFLSPKGENIASFFNNVFYYNRKTFGISAEGKAKFYKFVKVYNDFAVCVGDSEESKLLEILNEALAAEIDTSRFSEDDEDPVTVREFAPHETAGTTLSAAGASAVACEDPVGDLLAALLGEEE